MRRGLEFYLWLLRRFGAPTSYVLLQPVVIPLLVWNHRERAAVLSYLRRLRGPRGLLRESIDALHIFYQYACSLSDRALLSIRGPASLTIKSMGAQRIMDVAAEGKGVVLLGSHCGNQDIASGVLPGKGVSLSAVMVREQGDVLGQVLDSLSPETSDDEEKSASAILQDRGPASALAAVHRLKNGEVLALKGDRVMSDEQGSVDVPLLGWPARLPSGPFVLAALSGAPIMLLHCYRNGFAGYEVRVDEPRYLHFESGRDKQEQLQEWASWYAARLADMARVHPYQWFNFQDPWLPARVD